MKALKCLLILLSLIIVSCESATEPKDCAGVAGGTAVTDQCGTCDSDAINDCVQDCAGVWGGNATATECDGCTSGIFDCAGICDGTATTAECDGCTSGVFDCASTCDGTAVTDQCGTCAGGFTGQEACIQDCNGNWGGTVVEDCTDVCGGTHLDSDCGTTTDNEGNIYKTIIIGNQTWMAENLIVTHYNNGDPIQYVQREEVEPGVWVNLTTGAYGIYNDDDLDWHNSFPGDGILYNWYTVDDSRGVCPGGWHVPFDTEYTILTDYLGGESVAAKKMKKTNLWNQHNQYPDAATNESGFTAVPAGAREFEWAGAYGGIYHMGTYWSATNIWEGEDWAISYILGYDHPSVISRNKIKKSGYSVRCIKD